MRVVIEILNGCVCEISATAPCEVVVIDRDQMAEETLPDGDRGYSSVWEARVDPAEVKAGFKLAKSHQTVRYRYIGD